MEKIDKNKVIELLNGPLARLSKYMNLSTYYRLFDGERTYIVSYPDFNELLESDIIVKSDEQPEPWSRIDYTLA